MILGIGKIYFLAVVGGEEVRETGLRLRLVVSGMEVVLNGHSGQG